MSPFLGRIPHALVALGFAAAIGAAVLFVRQGEPLDARAIAPLLVMSLAGALFGGALLALRMQAARRFSRPTTLLVMLGSLVGGFAAFALMAIGAESGQMALASGMALLVLLALGGIATGGAYLSALSPAHDNA